MATDNGLSALALRIGKVEEMLAGDWTPAGHAVGKGARREAKAVAADVSGGDGVLSHMGRRGARLGMRYDLAAQGRTVIVKLGPAGPWMLTEKGGKPHTIPRATSRRRRGRGGARYLMAPGYNHPVRAPVEHPGTKGSQAKRSVSRTFERIRAQAPTDFHEAYVAKLGEIFRG